MTTFSRIAAACAALGIDSLEQGLQLVDAASLVAQPSKQHTSDGAWSEIQAVGPYQPPLDPFPLLPTRPALVYGLNSENIPHVHRSLLRRYPADHLVSLVQTADEIGHPLETALGQLIDQRVQAAAFVYLPPLDPLQDLYGADGPLAVVQRLLGPHGCPWDREQTHQSLRRELLAETHEVLEALDANDVENLAEELGDLLLQVLMHSEMARQAGEFTLGDVYHHIGSKLIRRHPHIFGDTNVEGSAEVLRNWDSIKQAERAAKGQDPRGTLDGIPVSLPSLMLAQETIRKASKAGFDSDDTHWPWNKLREELAELEEVVTLAPHERDQRRVEEEFGDLLLASVKLARLLDLDAESALRTAVGKFRTRFTRVEQLAQTQSLDLKTISVAQKEELWEQAKSDEPRG